MTSHGMVLCAKSADKKVRCKSRLMVLVLLIKAWMMSTHRRIAVFEENELGLDDFDLISRLCMVHVLLHHNRNGLTVFLTVHKRVILRM